MTLNSFLTLCILGALTGLGQIHDSLWFCTLLGFTSFLYYLDTIPSPKKLLHEICRPMFFMTGYFCVSLYWVSAALFIEIEKFFWLLPFSFLGLPLILGGIYGLSSLLIPWQSLASHRQSITFVAAFILADILRSFIFTGFPWASFGSILLSFEALRQIGSIFSFYGVNILILLYSYGFYILLKPIHSLYKIILISICMLTLFGALLWGQQRIKVYKTFSSQPEYVRIIQPNIKQALKWQEGQKEKHLLKLIRLSNLPTSKPLSFILWPESAFPYYINAEGLKFLIHIIPMDQVLLTGALRYGLLKGENKQCVYNTLLEVSSTFGLISLIDKQHLTPFGEFVPLPQWFKSTAPNLARKIAVGGGGDISSGKEKNLSKTCFLKKTLPIICYEALFLQELLDRINLEQSWIIHNTNDAWFGKSVGPLQHLKVAQMRSIELGLPTIRSANTGISAFIDATGQVIQSLPLEQKGILDGYVPAKFEDPTLLIRLNPFIRRYLYLFFILFIIMAWIRRWRLNNIS